MKKLLLIDNCNFINYPIGGTLSAARALLENMPEDKVALVGITTNFEHKVGKWNKLTISSKTYDYFPICRFKEVNVKPIVPLRLLSFFWLLYYLPTIRKRNYSVVYTRTPQFLFSLFFFKWESIGFCFAGLGNSVKLSRYRRLRFLGKLYNKILIQIINNRVDCLFAAADKNSINEYVSTNNVYKKIISLPTRIDNNIFINQKKSICRQVLNIDINKRVYVTTGRLCWVKGWDFLVCVLLERLKTEDCILIFVGDGEDRTVLENKYSDLIINNKIIITGFLDKKDIALYLNSSDVYLFGSYIEGWSTSLVEAASCGIPIVTTNVSSASDIINNNINGYIVSQRSIDDFCFYIDRALALPPFIGLASNISLKYCNASLPKEIALHWEAFKRYTNE